MTNEWGWNFLTVQRRFNGEENSHTHTKKQQDKKDQMSQLRKGSLIIL